MTTFDAYVAEVRELQEQLRSREDLSDAELDRMIERLAFLREQIDLARKEVEGSRQSALQVLQEAQRELDDEQSP